MLVGPATLSRSNDVRDLLQNRLLLLCVICTVFFSLALPFQTVLFGFDDDFVWHALLPQCIVLATLGANAALLWRHRQRSLAWLRADEVICYATLTVAFSWMQYELLRGALPLYGPRGPLDLFLLAGTWDFTWFVLIVTYGLFIPNSWRRCAVVVGALALIPLAIATMIGVTITGVESLVLGQFLFLVSIHMGLATTFAIFAARRDEVLRALASEV